MALDLSKDYLVIDDLVTITYKAKTSPIDLSAPFTIAHVYKEEVIKSQADLVTDFRTRETFFHVWRVPMEAAGLTTAPKRHDLIEHPAGMEWVVQEVAEFDLDSSGLAQRFRCRCAQSFP